MDDTDLLPISALSHFLWCSRRCALVHIEQAWVENMFTAEGRVMHEKVHQEQFEKRKDIRIECGMPLRSLALGLIGKADVVEFHKNGGKWVPFPVEYKRGKPKANDCDKVQLCAQALCLEEMLKVQIPSGALFYGITRHRLDVEFDESLRRTTTDTAQRLHDFIKSGKTPKPEYSKKCESCSFKDVCMPKSMARNLSVKQYIEIETNNL